ncbi:MAG: integrase [Halothiobacillaceae bacterium]
MNDSKRLSLEEIRAFLAGAGPVEFAAHSRGEVYAWVERTLVRHEYATLGKVDKGVVRRYLAKMTGLSRAQVTRLIASYTATGRVRVTEYKRHRFATRYTKADVELLAYVDKAHGNLSGPATRRILEREYEVHGIAAYERLARISSAQIYRLRGTAAYRKRNVTYEPTRPTVVSIGERRRPEPNGRPGFLRLDTVHQGDFDGWKGVYHINAVGEVTQWQVMAATPKISELWLIPVLEAILEQFPFRILGFHSDNGSEYINHYVSRLLGKLFIEQTKSRSRHSNDNGLVEAKNGAVIRKHLGYGYIDAQYAEQITGFYREHLNPYVNFHRPCAVPELRHVGQGKIQRAYRRWATPYELLQEVPKLKDYLRPGITAAQLQSRAAAQSDTEAALAMQEAKRELFRRIGRKIA